MWKAKKVLLVIAIVVIALLQVSCEEPIAGALSDINNYPVAEPF